MRTIIENIRNNEQVKKRPYIEQFVKFAIVGTANTFVDFGIYFGLTRSSEFWEGHYLWANFIAFVFAATSSYIFNKNWTFKDSNRKIHIQYPKFLLVSAVGLSLNETILYLLVTQAVFYDLWAKAFAACVVLFWNFVINKIWTFRPEQKSQSNELQNPEV
ncbi:GtrA family protein [Patescibacteria group bacterium]|nr:GtrA family protein [Patescibacteria group bacterium]